MMAALVRTRLTKRHGTRMLSMSTFVSSSPMHPSTTTCYKLGNAENKTYILLNKLLPLNHGHFQALLWRGSDRPAQPYLILTRGSCPHSCCQRQGGRSWQPFKEHKKTFRRVHIFKYAQQNAIFEHFRDKNAVFVHFSNTIFVTKTFFLTIFGDAPST